MEFHKYSRFSSPPPFSFPKLASYHFQKSTLTQIPCPFSSLPPRTHTHTLSLSFPSLINMYSPEAISRDLSSNLMFSGGGDALTTTTTNNGFKNGYFEGDFFKTKEMCDSSSDLFQQHNAGTGLARYRSAPSSYFASYLDGAGKNSTTSNNSDSSESDTILSAFLNCNEPGTEIPHKRNQFQEPQQQQQVHQLQMKVEVNEAESNPSRFLQSNRVAPVGYQAAVSAGGGGVVGSYAVSNSSSLLRQSSSPAGFFAGYDVMREVANFRNGYGTNGEASPSTSGFHTNLRFPSSSSMFMPTIAENGNEAIGTAAMDHGQIGNANGNQANQGFVPGYQNEHWNGSSFNGRDDDLKMYSGFNPLENLDLEPRNHGPGLTHHLSLPKPAANASAIEKYLQFRQDSVPCKIRAKRGFATHPRSIAERVRRTRISEKMKKLTDLFPNLDKQANTADMLDLAVEYIKDLQTQVQALTETRAKCICPPANLDC